MRHYSHCYVVGASASSVIELKSAWVVIINLVAISQSVVHRSKTNLHSNSLKGDHTLF